MSAPAGAKGIALSFPFSRRIRNTIGPLRRTSILSEPFSEQRVSRTGSTCFAHGLKEEDTMWIAIFASTLSLALCFCVAATLMQPKTDQSQVLGR
jgi:hypothetical protein